jgi:hypothetical protein
MKILKGARRSNTVQFNGLILGILTALAQTDVIANNPNAVMWLGFATTVVNLLLRAKTDESLEAKAEA